MFGIRSLLISALILMLSVSSSPKLIVPPTVTFPVTFMLPPTFKSLTMPTPPATVSAPSLNVVLCVAAEIATTPVSLIVILSEPAVKNLSTSSSADCSASMNVSPSVSLTPPIFFQAVPL